MRTEHYHRNIYVFLTILTTKSTNNVPRRNFYLQLFHMQANSSHRSMNWILISS